MGKTELVSFYSNSTVLLYSQRVQPNRLKFEYRCFFIYNSHIYTRINKLIYRLYKSITIFCCCCFFFFLQLQCCVITFMHSYVILIHYYYYSITLQHLFEDQFCPIFTILYQHYGDVYCITIHSLLVVKYFALISS